jgi:hypothetical protein
MADHSGSLRICSQHLRSNPDSRDSPTGSVRPFRAIGVPIPSLEYYGRRRVGSLLALARVVLFVPELARVARCKATSVFAAAFVFLSDILFPFCALDSGGRFGTAKAGFGVWGVSAISSPNRAATSLSSSTLAVPDAAVFSGGACPALASNSFSSTLRSTKRS